MVRNRKGGSPGHCGTMSRARTTSAKLNAASATSHVYVMWHHQLPEYALHGAACFGRLHECRLLHVKARQVKNSHEAQVRVHGKERL